MVTNGKRKHRYSRHRETIAIYLYLHGYGSACQCRVFQLDEDAFALQPLGDEWDYDAVYYGYASIGLVALCHFPRVESHYQRGIHDWFVGSHLIGCYFSRELYGYPRLLGFLSVSHTAFRGSSTIPSLPRRKLFQLLDKPSDIASFHLIANLVIASSEAGFTYSSL